jgi:hypothetical protein
MSLTENAPTCVQSLEGDIRFGIKARNKPILEILKPKSFTFVITTERTEIPQDLVMGVRKLHRSALRVAVTESLKEEVHEALECYQRVGYNVGTLDSIERDGATFLVYTFTPGAHESD